MTTTADPTGNGGTGAPKDVRTRLRTPPDPTQDGGNGAPSRPVVGSFVLAYLLGAVLISTLVLAAGPWNVLANTRALAALIAAGILPLGEDDPGLGSGVPNIDLWIRSQQPVVWQLVLLAALLFVAVAVLKGLQFHRIARFVGIEGSFGQHFRAYLYGHGLNRMLPYRAGDAAWASALDAQGATLPRAARVVFIFKGFLLFEIAAFALIGLFLAGLLAWATALVPPLLILAAAWLLVRPAGSVRASARSTAQAARAVLSDLGGRPRMLLALLLLSLLAFLLIEIASYIVPQAFSTVVVPLVQNELRLVVVSAPLIVMAVVGGYVARLVPVTPGGIGQFEWAFALVLVTGGLPFPEAAVLALLVSAVRYATGALLFAGTQLTYGIETNLRRVLALFRRPQPRLVEETV